MGYELPRATAEALEAPLYEGNRHATIVRVVIPLIADGIPKGEIFHLVRSKMPPDKSDKEIWSAIYWAEKQNFTPTSRKGMTLEYTPKPQPPTKEQAKYLAKQFSGERKITEDAIRGKSPIPIPEELAEQTPLAFTHLYKPEERVNIVCKFTQPPDKPNKANPQGCGKILTITEWLKFFQEKGVPKSQAGAWIRPNPVKEHGTGSGGSIQDRDVTAYRFLLVESDLLDMPLQLGVLGKLKLPIAAIISSGGSSYHAWVKLDAESDDAFSYQAGRILSILMRFGIDQANKNPSRLARLPGVYRTIGASDGGEQKLIYLNPQPSAASIL